LSGLNFVSANLKGINFQKAMLNGTLFMQSDLSCTNFNDAHLTMTKFITSNLENSSLKTELRYAFVDSNTRASVKEKLSRANNPTRLNISAISFINFGGDYVMAQHYFSPIAPKF